MMNRGVLGNDVFIDRRDREKFIEILAETVLRFGWVVHAYVEMTNHFQFLAETPANTISRGLHLLESWYAKYFNVKWERVGHLFEKRALTVHVSNRRHLGECVRYIVNNPVEAKMTRSPGEWLWSSYRATAGLCDPPAFLNVDATRALFGGNSPESLRRFRDFVSDGIGKTVPWEESVKRFTTTPSLLTLPVDKQSPRIRAIVLPIPRHVIFDAVVRTFGASPAVLDQPNAESAALAFALLAKRRARSTLAEIGETLGVSVPTASRRYAAADARMAADPSFASAIASASRLLDTSEKTSDVFSGTIDGA